MSSSTIIGKCRHPPDFLVSCNIQTGDGEVEVDVILGDVADVQDETEVGKGIHKELEKKKQ